MNRPDVEKILRNLKGFQRRTVDYAFHRLFTAPDSTSRFLVADEVGLGKTLVARGVIAKAIDHLWDPVKRIDIVYICSNASIAEQNLRKLHVMASAEKQLPIATRLTLLAVELAEGFANRKVNFVSFTPGTSFNLRSSTGIQHERVVLYRLLREAYGDRMALRNLLQGGVSDRERWHAWCALEQKIAPAVVDQFLARLGSEDQAPLRDALDDAMGAFARYPSKPPPSGDVWPPEKRQRRNAVIGDLRRLLAKVCVTFLEPDLVILDEFQRFKPLLDEPVPGEQVDPARELARELFHVVTPEGHPVRVLALSATPYKLYTPDAEIGDADHYPDFIATTRFLLGGRAADAEVAHFEQRLARYRSALYEAARGNPASVASAKAEVEGLLSRVMSRTERVALTEQRDAMVSRSEGSARTLLPADVRGYAAHDALFQAVGAGDPMGYWKAAPHLLHFMRDYKFNRRLEETLERRAPEVAGLVRDHAGAWLERGALSRWDPLDPAQPKLRAFIDDTLGRGEWRLLWVPPTIPYWPLGAPFAGHESMTKRLVFSAWNVVPDVVSAVLSYHAERLATMGRDGAYDEVKKTAPLRFQVQDGQPRGMAATTLIFPCLWLADRAHPLVARAGGEDVRSAVLQSIQAGVAGLPAGSGAVDERWYWAAPVLLEGDAAKGFLDTWRWSAGDEEDDPRHFEAYVAELRNTLETRGAGLGARPDDLVEVLADIALGSPAVLVVRSLRHFGASDAARRELGAQVATAFWSLFNRRTSVALLHQCRRPQDRAYWRAVLGYSVAGNLHSVHAEQLHLLVGEAAWSDLETADGICRTAAAEMAETIRPKVSRTLARFYESDGRDVQIESVNIRNGFALRFGMAGDADDAKRITQDAVRDAFNGPWRPFVLTSTSVGQEGLDFHHWCHAITHWNLPGNPVDLEQREGRVHRFKGHAVRRNVAAAYADAALKAWAPGQDPWAIIFEQADHDRSSDLEPYWLMPGPYRIRRHVPLLPYAREVEGFARLQRQLAAYRVVFGQPRQQELLALLDRSDIDADTVASWVLDLRPPAL